MQEGRDERIEAIHDVPIQHPGRLVGSIERFVRSAVP
jgi:hypothetical protein